MFIAKTRATAAAGGQRRRQGDGEEEDGEKGSEEIDELVKRRLDAGDVSELTHGASKRGRERSRWEQMDEEKPKLKKEDAQQCRKPDTVGANE